MKAEEQAERFGFILVNENKIPVDPERVYVLWEGDCVSLDTILEQGGVLEEVLLVLEREG